MKIVSFSENIIAYDPIKGKKRRSAEVLLHPFRDGRRQCAIVLLFTALIPGSFPSFAAASEYRFILCFSPLYAIINTAKKAVELKRTLPSGQFRPYQPTGKPYTIKEGLPLWKRLQ
jgi:hypothetical protein